MLHEGSKVRRATGGENYRPSEEELKQIHRFAGARLNADQVYVRAMVLCTGEYDRDHERFSNEVLAQFAESIVGKSLLVGHRRDAAPEGLFYRAEVQPRAGQQPVLKAWFYMPITPENEHLRKLMDGGVIRYTSIGFRCETLECDLCGKNVYSNECPHIPGRPYGDDKATGTWRGQAEAVEGSLVYLGSQQDAMLTKGHGGGDDGAWEKLLDLVEELQADLATKDAEAVCQGSLAIDGQRFRSELKNDIRAICALTGDTELWDLREPELSKLNAEKLIELRSKLQKRVDQRSNRNGRCVPVEPDLSAYVSV